MANVSRVWANPVFARTVGASYDWAMGRRNAARRFGRVVMGADVDRVYRAMDVVAGMPDGATKAKLRMPRDFRVRTAVPAMRRRS